MNQAASLVPQIARTGRVAVLIDGENIEARHAPAIMAHAARLGPLQVRRVYGDHTKVGQSWEVRPELRFTHTGSGKNSADIRLVIDAVDLAHKDRADCFVVASSDSDFTHLAHFLRERGHRFVGIGEPKAPDRLRQACSEFVCLDPVAPSRALSDLERTLISVIDGHGDRNGLRITDLNPLMRRRKDAFRISAHPDKTWRAFLQKRTDLFSCDPKGPDARVRVRVASA